MIDNVSPPGAWQKEIERIPWKFDKGPKSIHDALSKVHEAGLWAEATLLAQEISLLRAEVARLCARSEERP